MILYMEVNIQCLPASYSTDETGIMNNMQMKLVKTFIRHQISRTDLLSKKIQ